MKETPQIVIGIDPDVAASGVACWDRRDQDFDYIKIMPFWELINEFQSWLVPIRVVIEASWLIEKSNWHGKAYQSKQAGEKIAKNVGANHQVGKLLAQYCEQDEKITLDLVRPKGKANSEYFKKMTGWAGRTNQEMRDAAMLVYGI